MNSNQPTGAAPGLEKYLKGGFEFEEYQEVPYDTFDNGNWAIRATSQNGLYVFESAGVHVSREERFSHVVVPLFRVARFSEVYYKHGEIFRQANEFGEQTVSIGALSVGSRLIMIADDTESVHWTTPLKSIEIANLPLLSGQ